MYVTPTIQLWIKFTSTFVDCSDWLLDCGDVDTIFNNYDTSLRLVETTAVLSSTIFTDKTIDNDDLLGKDIQIKYDGKIVFVGFISKPNYSSADYTIELDITSVLARLNKKMLQDTYGSGIIAYLNNFPVGQKYYADLYVYWWNFIDYLGWDAYEVAKANGTLGDNYPPTQTETSITLVKPLKVIQYIFELLTGFPLTTTDTYIPFPNPLGDYDGGLSWQMMWNMNQDNPCSNQAGRNYDKIPLWWDFINLFSRGMVQIMWNAELGRFETKTVRCESYNDPRKKDLPDSRTTFETNSEVMSMRRNMISKYGMNGSYLLSYITPYTPQYDSIGNLIPIPDKRLEYSEYSMNGIISDAEESIEYPEVKHITLMTKTDWTGFPFPYAGLYRFRKSYTNTKVLTYPLYDSSDWDGSAFYNLLQNKFVNKDGVYFSELEFFEKVV